MPSLSGKHVAVLVTSGVEEVELTEPVGYLKSKGADVTIITPKRDELKDGIKAKRGNDPGEMQKADEVLENVDPNDFDALLIPGGSSPDHLRLEPGVTEFIKAFQNKPIFAICHGPQILISSEMVKGRKMTSWPSVAVDLKNAGAEWVDKQVVIDGNLITSRKPDDIPAFNAAIEEILAHAGAELRRAA